MSKKAIVVAGLGAGVSVADLVVRARTNRAYVIAIARSCGFNVESQITKEYSGRLTTAHQLELKRLIETEQHTGRWLATRFGVSPAAITGYMKRWSPKYHDLQRSGSQVRPESREGLGDRGGSAS